MDTFLERLQKFDPHRIALAPLLGLLAGFLANRAHGGQTGWTMLAEMLLGGLLLTFGAAVLANLSALIRDREAHAAAVVKKKQAEAAIRRAQLMEVEAERYRTERFFREQILVANRRTERLEVELLEQRGQATALRNALGSLEARAGGSQDVLEITRRLEQVENNARIAEEAREKIIALETAQFQLREDQVAIGRKATLEAEEVKASLLQLAITESQRMRNTNAPDNDQSGRIIELENRIRRLAREIEVLSKRQPVVQPAGQASLVSAGGTQDKARMGFLQAMLDANKTLRTQIKDAA